MQPRDVPVLPELEPGIQLLEFDADCTGAFHSLVIDELLTADTPGYWIDAGGHARTARLRELAPSDRVLERLQVARGFTPYQHYTLVKTLPSTLSRPPSLVVCPDLDRLYRDGDIDDELASDALVRELAVLARVAREYEIPVLLTRARADEFSDPIETAATRTITCSATRFGPRFTGDDVETLVYPDRHGTVQTTLAFWRRVLEERATIQHSEPTAMEVSVSGSH